MKLPEFIYSATISNNTSLGRNKAFPPKEDLPYEYHLMKERFKHVVESVKNIFGYVPSVVEAEKLLNRFINKTMKIERPLRHQLEELCESVVNGVLSVPEETVLFSCELVDKIEPNKELRILPEGEEGEPTYTFNDVKEIMRANDAILKRRMINSLVQGVSYSLMSQALDTDTIRDWSQELMPLYEKVIALNDYLLFTKQEKITDKNPMLGAYVETDLGKGDEKTVISAQGLIYPLLLQESFRGFFELFASHGLPNDTKHALYIIRRADFIMAEAWDLRMGQALWNHINASIGEVEYSVLPYLFSTIVQLSQNEFNETMQNILLGTNKGKTYIKDIVAAIEHDIEYQQFKKDINNIELDKTLITDDGIETNKMIEEEETNNKFVHSDGFKAWFGDWENSSEHSVIMSDIVDKDYDNSKPLLVWNSSPHKIKLGKHKSIGGEYLNGLHFSVMKGLPHGKNKCVCYLNMRKPYYAKKHSEIICPSDTLISKLKRSGCDGIIFDPWMYNDDNGLKSMDKFEFLVFDKSQVKVVNRDLTESKLMQLITEADSRLKKAETIIRNSFSGLLNPDGRVTSPEYYVNGNPETTWLQYILYSLRHTFDLMSNSDVKYIPSIARFAVGELGFETQEPKQDKLNDLMKIVQIIKSNPEKYSKYLNASSYDELEQTFAPILKRLNDEENERINNASYNTNFGEYQIIEDADYETAKEFGNLSHPDSKLCYTQSESTWKDYTQDGLNKVYILLSQDWKNLQPEHTDDLLDSHVPQNETAYDRYGLSMIFVFVNQKNELIYCNTRWNHQAKYKQGCSTDHALTREDLSYIVRQPFMNVFKGYSDEELLDKGVVPFHLVQPLLDNGASLDDIFEKVVELPVYNVYIVLLHDKQNIVSSDRKLLFKEWYPSILRMNGFVLLCLESGAYQVATVNGQILSNKHEYVKIQFNTKIQCFMCYRRVGHSDEAQLFFVRKDGSYVTDKPCFGGYLSSGFFEPRIMDDKIVVSFKGMDSFTCNVLNVNTGKFMLEKNVYNIQIHETYSLIDTGSRKMICDKDLNDLFPNYNFRSVDYAGDIDNELIFFYCETYAGKYSIFSNQGKQITQVWFETPLSYLKDNKFKVKDNGNEFYIDLNGNIVN